MKISQTPIVPVKQAMVRIAGYDILAICMADGNTAAGLRMICDLLGVDRVGQLRKLQVDPAFRGCLILARVEIAGKQQVARFIIAEFIPLWLKGIHPSKVAPEARETLEEIRSVAVDALRAFFFPETKAQPQAAPPKDEPKRSAPPRQEPDYDALPPPEEEGENAYWGYMIWAHDGLERHIRGLDAFQKRTEAWMVQAQQYFEEDAEVLNQHTKILNQHTEALNEFKKELKALVAQVRQLEGQMGALTARVTRLETPGPLNAEHLGEMRGLMQALGHQTGQQAPALERELAAAFGVEVLEQLPEAGWGQIAAWLHQRLGW